MNLAESLRVESCGIDTWSPAWTVDSRRLDDQMASLFSVQGPAGSRMMKEPTPSGHRLGFFPHAGFMFAEGHPAGEGLASGDTLQYRLVDLELELSDLGLHMGGTKFAGMRRMDATADIRFDKPTAGIVALAALSAIQFPRVKVETIRGVGDSRVETVLLKGRAGRKTLGRMYDKGVESSAVSPGLWTRFEDQRRYAKATRPNITQLTAPQVRERFHQRFVPLYQATKGVTVAGPTIIAQHLVEMIEREEITAIQARNIAGYIELSRVGVDFAKTTKWRHRAAAREAGVYSSDGLPEELEETEVDVASILEAALDSDGWGCTG